MDITKKIYHLQQLRIAQMLEIEDNHIDQIIDLLTTPLQLKRLINKMLQFYNDPNRITTNRDKYGEHKQRVYNNRLLEFGELYPKEEYPELWV